MTGDQPEADRPSRGARAQNASAGQLEANGASGCERQERTPTPSTSFSAVIVTYNSAATFQRCLASVLGEAEARQVLVVDNASRDGTLPLLEKLAEQEPRLRILANPENVGFGRACNQAFRQCTEPFVLLLNPDAQLNPSALEALARGFSKQPQAAILGLKVFDWDGRTVQLSCRAFPGFGTVLAHRFSLLTRLWPKNPWSKRYLATDFTHDQARPFDWVSGCAMALRRDCLEALGGFDEGFFLYCEDVDLCKRAWQAGFEVVYWPEAEARHQIGGSSRSAVRRSILERHRSMWRYYQKHHRGGRLLDRLTWLGIGLRCGWQLLKNR